MTNQTPTNKTLYTFNWKQGGYNQVYATSMKEARQIVDKEFPTMGGSKSIVNLTRLNKKDTDIYWRDFPAFD